tara:strand:- start:548 stop:1126 length:579 start_codon:yes stop_codon:yes gene_type:complete
MTRIFKPDSGQDLKLQNNGGTGSVTITDAGDLTIDSPADQHVSINNGNLVMGTAGKGIDFSGAQTPAGGTTDEVLSGYERGTWVPTLKRDGASGTYTAHANDRGNYVRVGDVVYLNGYLRGTLSDGSGGWLIGGESQGNLPFTVTTSTYAFVQNATVAGIQTTSSVSTSGIYCVTLTSGNQYGFFCMYYTTD